MAPVVLVAGPRLRHRAEAVTTTDSGIIDLMGALQRSVNHIRQTIEAMEQTIAVCGPDHAAYWQAKVDDLRVAIAVLERA